MNENSKTEIEELLSGSLDDALSQRQQTELKRLLHNHPEMAEQLRMMERQRQLLCSLPVETAPASLVEDVKARLERNLILEDAARMRTVRSRANLMHRRFTAAAAMLFLPLALLGYVVYRIVTPVPDDALERQTADTLLKDEVLVAVPKEIRPPVLAPLPFNGSLILTSERPMLVAQSIEKQIFLKSLEHQTIPNRTAEVTAFQIECPAEVIADFLESLSPLWNQIADSRLTLAEADSPEHTITIDHVRPEQIQMLARQTDKMPMLAAARQYASVNARQRPDAESPSGQDVIIPQLPEIPRPILAWPQQESLEKPAAMPCVRLIIEVRRP
jgi:hypothetical protein